MAHLLTVVVLIAVVDSANPATIAPALYLAAGGAALRSLLGFTAGVFGVNLIGGLVLLGPGNALLSALPRPGAEARHVIEVGIGAGLAVVAAALWFARRRVARHVLVNEERIDRSSFTVGAALAVVELPTAVPYFAAIAAIVGSGFGASTQVAILTVFNVVFVAPLLAILAVRVLAGLRGQHWLARLRRSVDRRLAALVPALVASAAAVLLTVGTIGVLTD